MSRTIALIIPNRDGEAYLDKCFTSIASMRRRPEQTLLIDDASQDNSINLVRKNYPWVKILPSSATSQPQGFAATVNTGIKAAKADYIALLNNDVEVDRLWLLELESILERHPEAASASCRMLMADGKHINSLGMLLQKNGNCRSLEDGKIDSDIYKNEVEVFGPSGGAALWRSNVLEKIGLFDEDYFAYFEDADLAFRARAAGFSSIYSPKARIIHFEGRCPTLQRIDKVALRLRNSFWFTWSNFPASCLIKYFPVIIWQTLFRHLCKYGFRPWKVECRSTWKALGQIIISLPLLLKKRSLRQNAVKIDYQQIIPWLGKNPFTELP